MLHEGVCTLVLQFTDDTSPQIDHLFIFVRQLFVDDTLLDAPLRLLVEEVEEQSRHRFVRQDLQFMGVLQVHNLIADIICRLDEIHQRMAHIAQGLTRFRRTNNVQFIGNTLVVLLFADKEAELPLLAGRHRRIRILHDAGNGRVRHHEAPWAASSELVRQQTERIGITLEVRDVRPECRRYLLLQEAPGALSKERLDGLFARVPEGRIAQIVGQAGRRHDLSDFLEQRTTQFRMAFKLRAVIVSLYMTRLLSQPLVRYQFFPIHHISFF